MTADVVLGQAVLELSTDDGKFSSGLAAARGKAEGTLGGIGKTAAGVAAGIIGAQGIGGAISYVKNSIFGLGASFEQEMNILQEVSQASGDDMQRLDGLAKELGRDLTLPATSAKDAASAMLELAKAGLSVNDVAGAAKGVLQLSAAGNLSNARAAEIAANALNAFGLEGTEAVRIADLLAASANRSSLEVTDAADSLQMASAVYAAAGVPIEDLVTLISELGNAGIKGSDAGTSLKQMLLQLQTPTNKAKDLMRDLGFEVYDANGNMFDMRTIVGNLQTSMSGLTQQERDYALGVIFGSDAVRAANVLLKEGVSGFDEMKVAVTEQGAAADLAAARNKGLRGAVDGLKSAIETLTLGAVGLVSGPLEGLIRGAANVVNQVEPLARLLKLGFDGGQIGGQFSTIERAVFNFGQTLGNVHETVSGVLGTLGNLFKLGLEGGEIGGDWNAWERAAFAFGRTLREDIIPAAQDVAKWLRDDVLPAAQKVGEWLRDPVLPAIADFVKNDVWPRVKEIFTDAAKIFKEDLVPAAEKLAPIVWNNLGDLLKWFSEHKEAVVAVGIAWGTFVLTTQTFAAIKGIQTTFAAIATGIKGANLALLSPPGIAILLAAIATAIFLIWQNWDSIWPKLQAGWNAMKDLAGDLGGWVKDKFNDLKDKVVEVVTGIGSWLMDHWKEIVLGVLAVIFPPGAGLWLIITHWDSIKEKVGEIAGAIKDWVIEKFIELKNGAVEKLGDLLGWMRELPGKAMDALGDLAGWLLDKGKDLIGGLLKGAENKAGDLLNWIFALPAKVVDQIPNPLEVLKGIGMAILKGLLAGMEKAWEEVSGWVGGLASKIKGLKGPIEDDRLLLEPEGSAIMEGLGAGMLAGWNTAVEPVLMSVADMSKKWGQEVLAQMSDDYKAAVAISVAIAAEAAKGASGVAVLTNEGMAAAVTASAAQVSAATPSAAPPPGTTYSGANDVNGNPIYIPVVTGDPGIDRMLYNQAQANAEIAAQQAALLANGGLINRPTFALIGEDIRSRPEIVSPEKLMRRIVREESGDGGVTIDLRNSTFTGTPKENAAAIRDVLHTELIRLQRGAQLAGGF